MAMKFLCIKFLCLKSLCTALCATALIFTASPAFSRQTKDEKEAALLALRRVLVALEDGVLNAPGVTLEEKKYFLEDLKTVTANFSEEMKAKIFGEYSSLGQAKGLLASIKFRDLLLKVSGLETSPAQTPNAAAAGQIYKEQCASCHGVTGNGDGVLVAKMQQKPLPFSKIQQNLGTPFRYLNILLVGRPGTVMPSYKTKHDLETLWGLAFYVASLPYGGPSAASATNTAQKVKEITLTTLATTTDRKLLQTLEESLGALQKKGVLTTKNLQEGLQELRTKRPFEKSTPR
jgi:mono/diheme cytochrome c family protein